jgi:K+-transporting ATPase A subunit
VGDATRAVRAPEPALPDSGAAAVSRLDAVTAMSVLMQLSAATVLAVQACALVRGAS